MTWPSKFVLFYLNFIFSSPEWNNFLALLKFRKHRCVLHSHLQTKILGRLVLEQRYPPHLGSRWRGCDANSGGPQGPLKIWFTFFQLDFFRASIILASTIEIAALVHDSRVVLNARSMHSSNPVSCLGKIRWSLYWRCTSNAWEESRFLKNVLPKMFILWVLLPVRLKPFLNILDLIIKIVNYKNLALWTLDGWKNSLCYTTVSWLSKGRVTFVD